MIARPLSSNVPLAGSDVSVKVVTAAGGSGTAKLKTSADRNSITETGLATPKVTFWLEQEGLQAVLVVKVSELIGPAN